jgi:hypothetical protein
MTPTRLRLYTAGVLVGLLGTALWSYGRLADARDAAAAAADNLATCRDLAGQIESLRRRPSLAGSRELKEEELTSRIDRAAAAAKFDEGSLDRIEPGPPRRLGETPYRETPTVVYLRRVTLRQLFTFLHALAGDGASTGGLHVRRVDLSAPRDAPDADGDRWNVETTLAQLVYAPKSVSSAPPAAAGPLE